MPSRMAEASGCSSMLAFPKQGRARHAHRGRSKHQIVTAGAGHPFFNAFPGSWRTGRPIGGQGDKILIAVEGIRASSSISIFVVELTKPVAHQHAISKTVDTAAPLVYPCRHAFCPPFPCPSIQETFFLLLGQVYLTPSSPCRAL